MPNHFPVSLAYLGKIIQFLSQLKYDMRKKPILKVFENISIEHIEKYLRFFLSLSNSLVILLYFEKDYSVNSYKLLHKILILKTSFPNIEFEFILKYFNIPKFKTNKDLKSILLNIENLFLKFSNEKNLILEMEEIQQKKFLL